MGAGGGGGSACKFERSRFRAREKLPGCMHRLTSERARTACLPLCVSRGNPARGLFKRRGEAAVISRFSLHVLREIITVSFTRRRSAVSSLMRTNVRSPYGKCLLSLSLLSFARSSSMRKD